MRALMVTWLLAAGCMSPPAPSTTTSEAPSEVEPLVPICPSEWTCDFTTFFGSQLQCMTACGGQQCGRAQSGLMRGALEVAHRFAVTAFGKRRQSGIAVHALAPAAQPQQQNEKPEAGRDDDDDLRAGHGNQHVPLIKRTYRRLRSDSHAG